MAENQGGNSGGNRPKPGGGQSAKDASRAQSRQIAAKGPKGKSGGSQGRAKVAATAGGGGKSGGGSGGSGGGNTPRPGRQPAPAPPARNRGMLWAWGAVAVVVVVIVAIVLVKVVGGNSNANATYTATVAAPAQVVHDVTSIPASVYDKVGVTSPTIQVHPPTPIKPAQPSMTLDGKSPSMLYIGAEYCPYCAAERWAMTAALSRFGTWSGLEITASSHTDLDPATHTFSYATASLSSSYIHFKSVEMYTNIPTSGSQGYTRLQSLTSQELANANKYSSSQYNPANTSSAGGISFPYVNIDNKYLIAGASYDPAALSGLTWQQIASQLDNPNNPVTQAIVATANYISAGICAASKNAPADVCTSSGVQAATKALAGA